VVATLEVAVGPLILVNLLAVVVAVVATLEVAVGPLILVNL